jgi:hypothetical protein
MTGAINAAAAAMPVTTPPAEEAESPELQVDIDGYYGGIVLDDDGSFAETPEIVSNVAGDVGNAATLGVSAVRTGEVVRFAATAGGARPAHFSVLVFDATGRTMFSGSSETGAEIEWNLHEARGVRAPRGMYVYRTFVRHPDGRAAAGAPAKLVIP